MTTTQSPAALSTEALELITDRTSHALDHTEQLQALCRMLQQARPTGEELSDDHAGDWKKVLAGMSLPLALIQAALDDVRSILPRVEAQAEEETEQDAVSRNGVEDMNPTAALLEA